MVWTRIRHGGNRWPKRITTWSPGGRRRRGRPEVKWEKGSGVGYEAEEFNR